MIAVVPPPVESVKDVVMPVMVGAAKEYESLEAELATLSTVITNFKSVPTPNPIVHLTTVPKVTTLHDTGPYFVVDPSGPYVADKTLPLVPKLVPVIVTVLPFARKEPESRST